MDATVARAALESARRSRDVEAGGVTRDSNAHLTASFRLSTRGRAKRVEREADAHQGPMFTTIRF